MTQNQTLTVTNPDLVRLHRKYADRYVVIVIINKYKNYFYFYGRRQGNGCEIQFRGLLCAREVLISRTVAHNSYLYSKAAKSYFDERREKLSSRPLCGRDKTISRSSKDFVAKVYTTFCVQPENL
jgi:hypothetical protein